LKKLWLSNIGVCGKIGKTMNFLYHLKPDKSKQFDPGCRVSKNVNQMLHTRQTLSFVGVAAQHRSL